MFEAGEYIAHYEHTESTIKGIITSEKELKEMIKNLADAEDIDDDEVGDIKVYKLTNYKMKVTKTMEIQY